MYFKSISMNHTLNEKLKRLEPTDKKCQYCRVENSQHMEDNYFIPVFREKDRTNIVVYRSVKYAKLLIGISRCKTCLDIHEKCRKKANLYSAGIFVAIVFFATAIWGFYGLFAVPVGIFVCVAAYTSIESSLVRKHDVFPKQDGAEYDDTVQEFIINGWSFTQPSA